MRAVVAAVGILALLVAGFAAGRFTALRGDEGASEAVSSFRLALATGDPITRWYRLGAFLRGLGPEDLPDVLAVLETKRVVGVSQDELELLMLAWAGFDAAGALEWAMSVRGQAGWPALAPRAAIYAWGFHDPAGARQALDALEDQSARRSLEGALVTGWIQSGDAQGVTDYLASLRPGNDRQVWTNWLAKELLRDGVEAVIGWADGVPEDAPHGFKAVSFRIAANAAALRDPQRVAAWYQANAGNGYAAGALRYISRRWVGHADPPALFDWLITLPPSAERDRAVQTGFASWLDAAPDEAQSWLRDAPRTAALDPALERVATKDLAKKSISFPEALEWALQVQGDKARRELLIRLGRRWNRQSPEAPQAWLAENELSEGDREAFVTGERERAARAETPGQEREVVKKPRRAGLAARVRGNQRAAREARQAQPDSPVTD